MYGRGTSEAGTEQPESRHHSSIVPQLTRVGRVTHPVGAVPRPGPVSELRKTSEGRQASGTPPSARQHPHPAEPRNPTRDGETRGRQGVTGATRTMAAGAQSLGSDPQPEAGPLAVPKTLFPPRPRPPFRDAERRSARTQEARRGGKPPHPQTPAGRFAMGAPRRAPSNPEKRPGVARTP